MYATPSAQKNHGLNSILARNSAVSISGWAMIAKRARMSLNSLRTGSQWNSMSWLPWTIVSACPRATNSAIAASTSVWRSATRFNFARAWSEEFPSPCASSSSLGAVSSCARAPSAAMAIPMKSMKSPAMTALHRSPAGATRA